MTAIEIDLGRILDALPGLVWTALPDGRAEYVGKGWLDYTGMPFEDAIGAGWLAAVNPEDTPQLLTAWGAIIASGRVGEVEARLRRHDGEYRWFLFRACPMPEPSGEVARWCGMNFDIDDRVRAEEIAHEHQRRYEQVIDGLPVITALFSPTGKIIFRNRQMLEYLGETAERDEAQPSAYNYHPDDRHEVLSAWSASTRTGRPFDREARLRRGDGTYRWHRTVVFPLRNAAEEIELWYGLSIDIEDTKRAEAKLAAEKRLLELVVMNLPLPEVLTALCRRVEDLAHGACCSILLVEPGRTHFRLGAGPSLPAGFNAASDGSPIDAGCTPSALAVTRSAPVVTSDPANDPRWQGTAWSALMTEHGLRSCRSMPIVSGGKEVLGAFDVYRRATDVVAPSDEQELIERFAQLAGIAIERARAAAALTAGDAELREAYRHLTEAQRLSQTGSFTADLVADKHNWSEEFYRICDFEPGTEVKTQTLQDIVHPEDLAAFSNAVQSGLAGEEPDFLFRIVTRRGVVKHLRGIARVTEQVAGRPIFMGAVQDVTESRIAEMALQASEAELRRAYAHLTEAQQLSATGSFTSDLLADEHIWSEELYRVFEADPATKPTLQSVAAVVHPEDLQTYLAEVERGIAGQDLDFVFRIVTAKGSVKHLHAAARLSEQVAGRPVFRGAVQDVTESKIAEAAIKESEAELRQAYRHLTEAQRLSKTGSFTSDLMADHHTWSDEFYRICGFEPGSEITIQKLQDIIHPEDVPAYQEAIQRGLDGEEASFGYRILPAPGVVKHLRGTARLTEQAAGRPIFIGAIQDVTETKAAEEALNRARTELTNMARVTTLGALTASIAHEVNQPLAGIITNASTCLRMLGADPPNVEGARATAQRTIRDGNRASDVIQRLRTLFARKQPKLEPVDLNDAAREVLALSASELQQCRVVLRTDLADGLPAVSGDRIQLQQVMLNLVRNACDAMSEVTDRARDLTVTTSFDAGSVTLCVRDAGVGIEPQNMERLFDAFFTTKTDGMGVGLSISKSIIEGHEGRLWADANDGAGATLSFSVPVGAGDMAATRRSRAGEKSEHSRGRAESNPEPVQPGSTNSGRESPNSKRNG